jgi:hypothetical protein
MSRLYQLLSADFGSAARFAWMSTSCACSGRALTHSRASTPLGCVVPFSAQSIQKRSFKFHGPTMIEVVPGVFELDQSPFRNAQKANETHDLMFGAVTQGRYAEKMQSKRFHIKRKYRRQQHRWKGVIGRHRREFTTRLRWALKCMSRYALSERGRDKVALMSQTV